MTSPTAPPSVPLLTVVWQLFAMVVLFSQANSTTHIALNGIRQGPGWPVRLQPPVEAALIDYFQEWASARNWHHGLPIYTPQNETIPLYLNLPASEVTYHHIDYNAHPPTSVLLALPLGLLSYHGSMLIWHAISLGGFVLSFWLLGRELKVFKTPQWWWWILPGCAVLSFWTPWRDQFFHGQLNGIILPLLVGGWVASRRGYGGWAGGLIGCATVIKVFPAFLFLYFLLRKQYRACVVGLIVAVGLSALTMGVLGFSTYQDYVLVVLPSLGQFRTSFENQSLVAFWHRLFVHVEGNNHALFHAPLLAWTCTALSGVVVIGLCVQTFLRAPSHVVRDRCYWLFVIAMVLLGPLTWIHSPILISVPLIFLLMEHGKMWRSSIRSALIVLLICFYFFDQRLLMRLFIERGMEFPLSPLHSLLLSALPCYVLLAIFFVYRHSILSPQTDQQVVHDMRADHNA